MNDQTTQNDQNTNAAVEATNAAIAQTAAQSKPQRSYKLPLKMICTETAKTCKLTSTEYIEKKIAEFGSLENWRANYICREAKKARKDAEEAAMKAKVDAMIAAKRSSQNVQPVEVEKVVVEVVEQPVESVVIPEFTLVETESKSKKGRKVEPVAAE
jgi:hypothetical protein